MVLKRLEIYGFKSFADKLVVEFNDGMTGIVGPNGCGKSNVSDSIRWVLGEQSAKALRGGNMQDIIFNGTESRKSMSYCEVSLVFDNSTKVFPSIEYEEVVISRKLYKSGDSEYLINRQSCRLKDIVTLLYDTGIGREGYSIIGQGKVDEIMSTKAEDRRAVFEEAAGISKFKSRKVEAERKLARTTDNIEKLRCIILEIERQLGPLEKQSGDAIKYREFRNELQSVEVNNFLYHYDNNSHYVREIKQKIEEINVELKHKYSQSAQADKDFNTYSVEINNIDRTVSELKDEQTKLLVNAQKMVGDENILKQRLEFYKEEKSRIESELLVYNKEMAEVVSELNKSTQKAEVKQAELDAVKHDYAELEKQHLEIVDEIIRKENEIESGNKALIDTLNQLSDVKADISEMTAKMQALKEREDETNALLSENATALERAENERRENEKLLQKVGEEKKKLTIAYNETVMADKQRREEIFKLNTELRELSNGQGAIQARVKILREYKETYEAYNSSVKQLLQASKLNFDIKSKIDGVVAEVIRTPKEYETAIEMALGNTLQNIITQNEDDAKFIINFLKSKQIGRITFLPLTSARERDFDSTLNSVLKEKGCVGLASKLVKYDTKYNALFSGLLGKTLICEDMDSAIYISKRYNYAYKIVTLQGEVFARGAITGGGRGNNSTDLLKQDREIEMAQTMLEKYTKAFEAKSQKIKELEGDDFSLKIRESESQMREKDVEYATINERFSKSEQQIDGIVNSISRLKESLATINSKSEEIALIMKNISQNEEAIKGKNVNTDSIIKQSKELFGDKKQLKDSLSEKLTNFRVKIASIEKELASFDSTIIRLKEEKEDIERFVAESKLGLESNIEKIKLAEKELFENTVEEGDNNRHTQIKGEIAEFEERKLYLQQEIKNLNVAKDRLSGEIIATREKLLREENRIEKIDAQLRNLQEYISIEYNLSPEMAKAFRDEEFNVNGATSEISRLKREISKIGPVNEGAIEQFKTVKERHAEMSEQLQDLEKAELDLQKIIADLVKEMVERFETEFTKINKSFKVIFKDLFGGGDAELLLLKDEDDDPLEAGIEIIAQPPGKNRNKISLLSGGEKTITAIAILFAILRQRPLPFCVLDEVEAALDDSNAGLVAQYIKKYSAETQFVVITHRIPTMEMADRLYGVTMQEKGVSTMVAVDLKEAVKTAEN